jgi:hypothetical protein
LGIIFRRSIPVASRASVAQVNDQCGKASDGQLVERFQPARHKTRGETIATNHKSEKSENRAVSSNI